MSRSTLHVTESCRPVSEVLQSVGNKWTVLVVMQLWDGERRFSELRRSIPGVSQRMLTLTLRTLERDGLLVRKVTPTIPPRVDYKLTRLGRSLGECVRVLGQWAFDNHQAMDSARAEFDAKKTKATASPRGLSNGAARS